VRAYEKHEEIYIEWGTRSISRKIVSFVIVSDVLMFEYCIARASWSILVEVACAVLICSIWRDEPLALFLGSYF
jgi:hypothetical protein